MPPGSVQRWGMGATPACRHGGDAEGGKPERGRTRCRRKSCPRLGRALRPTEFGHLLSRTVLPRANPGRESGADSWIWGKVNGGALRRSRSPQNRADGKTVCHPERVSGSSPPRVRAVPVARWMLKRVQHDGSLRGGDGVSVTMLRSGAFCQLLPFLRAPFAEHSVAKGRGARAGVDGHPPTGADR
jgi:hypothetical protein